MLMTIDIRSAKQKVNRGIALGRRSPYNHAINPFGEIMPGLT